LAAQALSQQPGLGIVFATGYESIPKGERQKLAGAVLLQKPYGEQQIADALNAAMITISTAAGIVTRS
jgi:FixJ family two-component response regulator